MKWGKFHALYYYCSSQHHGAPLRLRVVLLATDLRLLGHGGHAAAPVPAEDEQPLLRLLKRLVCPRLLRVWEEETPIPILPDLSFVTTRAHLETGI